MKKLITVLSCLLFLSVSLSAQQYIRIKNRWKKDGKTDYKVHIQNAAVDAGAVDAGWWSGQWEIEKVSGSDFVRIKNRWKKDGKTTYYLHNQNGKLEAGAINQAWWSAQWKLVKAGSYYRIQNRWKPKEYIHIQGPKLASGAIDNNWWSAQWVLEGYKSSSSEVIEEKPTIDGSVSSIAWITRHYGFLKDKKLNEIVLPGSHDSGTHNLDGTWNRGVNDPFAPDTDDLKRGLSFLGAGYDKWAKAQERDIYQQLTDGIRYLDIRVCVDKSGNLKTCHGLYGVSLTEVIDDIAKFSKQYPKELILVDFNHFYDWDEKIRNNKENDASYGGIRSSKLNALASEIERKIGSKLAPNSLSPTSTLKQLMDKNRPIVVLWSKPLSGTFQRTYFWGSNEIKSSYADDIKEIRRDKIYHLDKQIRNSQNDSKFFLLAGQITPSNDLYKNSYDFTGTYPFGLENIAKQSNPVVLSYAANEWKNLRQNIISIDFYNQTGLVDLCKKLNGLSANPKGVSTADRNKSNWGKWKLGAGTIFAPSSDSEWRVEIDACHSDLDNTQTGNRITVQFWAGGERVASKYMDGVSNTCGIFEGNATFKIQTTRTITHIIVKTNGEDGFYIDEMYLYKGGNLKQHYGRDDGSGWCLSTDVNDANGGWKGKVSGGRCKAQYRFSY